MTINAAMPAVSQNMGYSGTAAATDMASTASDFGGALGNMMNAKNTVATENTVVAESEMTSTVQQDIQMGEAVITSEQTVAMNQLHKELMMKNAGYAQSELIAMLLNGTNTELAQLMSFSEIPQEALAIIESIEEMPDIPEMQTEIQDIIPLQTEDMDFVPEEVKAPETPEIMTEIPEDVDVADMLMSKAEDLSETVSDEIPAQKKSEEQTQSEAPETDEAMVQTVPAQISADEQQYSGEAAADDENKADAQQVISAESQSKSKMVQQEPVGEKISFSKADKSAENSFSIDNAQTETVQSLDKSEIKAPMTEDVTVKSVDTEQVSEAAEETSDFEVTFARAGKKISEKSEEALQLAKSISGTKSDSDLESEQKVTAKQQPSDAGVSQSTVKPEFIAEDSPKAQAPVKMTVNETYQLISEKAADGGKQTFTVELTPETLGKITVKMVNENGKLSVEILTETETAKQLFEARANELANNLRQNNVEIGSYRVETENDQLFNESFDGSSKNPYAERQQKESSDDEDEFERLISEMMGM